MKIVNVRLTDQEFDAVSDQVALARKAGCIASKSLILRTLLRDSLGLKENVILDEAKAVKVCTKCREIKPSGEYYRHNGTDDGLRSECKSCKRSYQRRYLAAR